jgi:hypothetical protein
MRISTSLMYIMSDSMFVYHVPPKKLGWWLEEQKARDTNSMPESTSETRNTKD